MKLLVYGSGKRIRGRDVDHFGHLVSPAQGHHPDEVLPFGSPYSWAMDNGAYSGFDPAKFRRTLKRFATRPRCLWVASPDVIGDADATLDLLWEWAPQIRRYGYPVALVSQDGGSAYGLPWDDIDALFIGGSTEWKLGRMVAGQVYAAKALGKLVHMGRVNSKRRMTLAYLLGCDSVDGSKYNWFPDTWLPGAGQDLDHLHRQGRLLYA